MTQYQELYTEMYAWYNDNENLQNPIEHGYCVYSLSWLNTYRYEQFNWHFQEVHMWMQIE